LTEIVIEWLPPSTLVDPRIESILVEIADGWSTRWFGDRVRYRIGRLAIARTQTSSGALYKEWISLNSGLACDWNKKQAIILAKLIVHANDPRHLCSENDNCLLISLAKEALFDFATSFANAVDVPKELSADIRILEKFGGLYFTLDSALKTTPELRFAIPLDVAAGVRKFLVKSSPAPAPMQIGWAEALGPEKVGVAVHVGKASISAQALCELALGDVVVLDTEVGGNILLVSEKNQAKICDLKLSLEDGGNSLLVTDI
jgi:hypothetical protein